jgi:hypothetical protein
MESIIFSYRLSMGMKGMREKKNIMVGNNAIINEKDTELARMTNDPFLKPPIKKTAVSYREIP